MTTTDMDVRHFVRENGGNLFLRQRVVLNGRGAADGSDMVDLAMTTASRGTSSKMRYRSSAALHSAATFPETCRGVGGTIARSTSRR